MHLHDFGRIKTARQALWNTYRRVCIEWSLKWNFLRISYIDIGLSVCLRFQLVPIGVPLYLFDNNDGVSLNCLFDSGRRAFARYTQFGCPWICLNRLKTANNLISVGDFFFICVKCNKSDALLWALGVSKFAQAC